jgi:hypothetical protein
MALPRSTQLNPYPTAFAPIVNPKPALDTESINFPERLDSEIQALNAAVNAYAGDKDEAGQSKTELAILAARQEFHRISAELNTAKLRLKALEEAGSALSLYNAAVSKAESGLQKTLELYTTHVSSQVVQSWFGQKVDFSRLSKERRNDLKLHARVEALRAFTHVSQYKANATQAEIERTVDVVGTKLVDLKTHIAVEQAAKS